MLKRLYVDNYKCLINFEIVFDPMNLFLGPNGSGKSTVFEVLQKLRQVVNGDSRVSEEFKPDTRTRWQSSKIQRFELELTDGNQIYTYNLVIDYSEEEQAARIKEEHLRLNGRALFHFEGRKASLFKDEFSEETEIPFDGTRSVIEFIPMYNERISGFKTLINEILVIHIDPRQMGDISERAERYPSHLMENFASWYRYLSQDQRMVFELAGTLKDVLPGFENFIYFEAGEKLTTLKTVFSREKELKESRKNYRFEELSDGQRALIALYTLLIAAQKDHYVLCIDEPENFLALPEIQPWLVKLFDATNEGSLQAILISHHPELINYLLASPVGYWFERDTSAPVRIKRIAVDNSDGLPVSELIARGWLNE